VFRLLVLTAASLVPVFGQQAFLPLEQWKAAVVAGDPAQLSKLYSTDRDAKFQAGKQAVTRSEEIAFLSGLKKFGMTAFNPRLLEIKRADGRTVLVLRISMTSGGSNLVASMQQLWLMEAGEWKIVASTRSQDFGREATRTLPQPARPDVDLYPDPREAEAEIRTGLMRAAKEHKRVLVVFGGNWCYDCHVLDATFHAREFAPLVESNYVVVHVNIGDDGKDNLDLAKRFGVAIDKGVPSLAVLEADGRVVYAQKNGEFEATEKIGPADVRAFLEKWKRPRG
jgi:thioredoxin 1